MSAIPVGRDFVDSLAKGLARILSNGLESIFGPAIHTPIFGVITRADLVVSAGLVLVVLMVHGLAAGFFHHKTRKARAESKELHQHVFRALGSPLYLLIWIFGFYVAVIPLALKLPPSDESQFLRGAMDVLMDIAIFVVLFWLFFRFTRVLEARLAIWAAKTANKFDDLFVPLIGRSLRVFVPVIGIIFALPVLGLPAQYHGVLAKGGSILLIVAVAVILFQAVSLGEKAVLTQFDVKAADNLHARKIYTQVHVLSKSLCVVIALFTVASVMMLFEEVRRLGTSILTSAGVIGIIIGFAAQKTIANLFAGFQLAMTQPIRLDDVVIVENEWGRIEEITLTYVVINLWDERRLVVPLSYFIEKPFQNWTRVSASLLGSVTISVDYSLPLAATRAKLKEIVETNPLWDKRFWNLQVTDASEKAMQVRVLATSADSSKSWDLRCAIREQLIAFIQTNYPQCLPRVRAEVDCEEIEAAEKL